MTQKKSCLSSRSFSQKSVFALPLSFWKFWIISTRNKQKSKSRHCNTKTLVH